MSIETETLATELELVASTLDPEKRPNVVDSLTKSATMLRKLNRATERIAEVQENLEEERKAFHSLVRSKNNHIQTMQNFNKNRKTERDLALEQVKMLRETLQKLSTTCTVETPWCENRDYTNHEHYDDHPTERKRIIEEALKATEIRHDP